jgi:hypothetical protein
MRSVGLVLVVVSLLAPAACSEDPAGSPGSAAAAGTSPSDGGAGVGGAPTDAPSLSGDEAIFQAMLDGTLPASEGIAQIERSGGWPIATASGFLFARLDDGAGPYRLAGDFNAWSGAPLQLGPGFYWSRVVIDQPDGAKYKFVDPGDNFAADPVARRYGYDEFGEYSLVSAVAAHLEHFVGVAGNDLAPRTIRIWVPAQTPASHLYAHDGQNLFDPNAPFGGWHLSESVSSTTLVVGIDNAGAARMDEYTHVPDLISGNSVGGKADAYAAFVKDVVRPLVEARYGSAPRVGVMGSSLGGLVAFYQVLRDPTAWHFAASLSGTFGWGSIGAQNETLIARFAKAGKLPVALYLDSGGGPGSGCVDSDGDGTNDDTPDAADNYCETEQMKQTLETLGWQHDQDLWHWWETDAAHNEAAWAARVWRPVQLFEAP